jgi:hypothetical protein
MTESKPFLEVVEEAKRANLTDEAIKLLDSRTGWEDIDKPTKNATSAVYFIRIAKSPKPIPRWLGEDDKCILNIGRTTGKYGMMQRSTAMAKGLHQVTSRLRNSSNRIGWLNGGPLPLEYSYCPVPGDAYGKLWEGLLLLAYYRRFGETPPTNRRLEYVRAGRKRKDKEWNVFLQSFEGFSCLEWETIRVRL